MDLQSFAIGIVTMIAFATVIATVIGILKVIAIIKDLAKVKRSVGELEFSVFNHIETVERSLNDDISNLNRVVDERSTEAQSASNAYTDKRIDKLIDTYFDLKKTTKLLKD